MAHQSPVYFAYAYALLVTIGGVMGFFRKGSLTSLAMGLLAIWFFSILSSLFESRKRDSWFFRLRILGHRYETSFFQVWDIHACGTRRRAERRNGRTIFAENFIRNF